MLSFYVLLKTPVALCGGYEENRIGLLSQLGIVLREISH